MKIKKTEYKYVLEIVENTLKECAVLFGISFKIDEILIYGSQLTKKPNPRDIDIFVQVNSIKIENKESFLKSYGPTSYKINANDLMEIAYVWLHENQPSYKNVPIDINFRDYSFDLDGDFKSLF